MLPSALPPFWSMMIWGLVATVAMTTVLQGAQGLGLSRLSLPFLAGTFFTGDRRWAVIVGFVFYVVGGWLFAFLYFVLFASLGLYTWWLGLAAGLLHGLFLLAAALPLLPYIHPRMASEYDGASTVRQLEPRDSWASTTATERRSLPSQARRSTAWLSAACRSCSWRPARGRYRATRASGADQPWSPVRK